MRRKFMSRVQHFKLGQDRPQHGIFVRLRLRAFVRRGGPAADLAAHGFQQAPHPLQFAGKFRLLLAGEPFLLAEGLDLFGGATAQGVQFDFQGRPLLQPLGLLLPRVFEDVSDLRVAGRS